MVHSPLLKKGQGRAVRLESGSHGRRVHVRVQRGGKVPPADEACLENYFLLTAGAQDRS